MPTRMKYLICVSASLNVGWAVLDHSAVSAAIATYLITAAILFNK